MEGGCGVKPCEVEVVWCAARLEPLRHYQCTNTPAQAGFSLPTSASHFSLWSGLGGGFTGSRRGVGKRCQAFSLSVSSPSSGPWGRTHRFPTLMPADLAWQQRLPMPLPKGARCTCKPESCRSPLRRLQPPLEPSQLGTDLRATGSAWRA